MDNSWKKVYTTDQEYKYVILKEKLAEAGIEANEVSKKGSEIDLFIGQIEIYVLEKDVEKALEIIKQHPEL
jgi:hypothetical protein